MENRRINVIYPQILLKTQLVKNGNINLLSILIDKDNIDDSHLLLAIDNLQFDMIKYLVSIGVDVNSNDVIDKISMLSKIVKFNEVLLEYSALLNVPSDTFEKMTLVAIIDELKSSANARKKAQSKEKVDNNNACEDKYLDNLSEFKTLLIFKENATLKDIIIIDEICKYMYRQGTRVK